MNPVISQTSDVDHPAGPGAPEARGLPSAKKTGTGRPKVKTWCAERSRNFSGTTSAPQISLADLILEASSGPRPSCFFMALWHESFLDAYASFFWFARSARDAAHKKPQPLGPLMPGDSHVRLRHCGGEAGAPLFVNAPVLRLSQRGDQLLLSPHRLWHRSCATLSELTRSRTLQENIQTLDLSK